MWSLNLESAVIHSNAAGRGMLERGGGAIVNLSSMSATRAFERRGPHCVAKAGLEMLTRCQALEWGPRGIRANAVAPGVVATEEVTTAISSGVIDGEAALAGVPLGRFAAPSDVAGAIAFLIGEDAAHVNGHVLAVDGGWSAAGGPL
jgi:2-deoxy-D-gluconate 3-dehydrogenase